MKVFRPVMIRGKYDKTLNLRFRKGEYGIDAVWLESAGETVMIYDLSSAYRVDGSTLVLCMEETYSPAVMDSKHVGLKELPNSFINVSWYEKDFDARIVPEVWNIQQKLIPYSRLAGYLVARDAILARVGRYLSAIPSWDVCLTLPIQIKLCEDIPGIKSRIERVSEIGDQIRGSANRLDKHLKNGTFRPQLLDDLLQKIHSLSDELDLAYNMKKLGYDVRFGDEGEPDFIINGIPAELKSRFPSLESLARTDIPSTFGFSDAQKDLVMEVRGVKKGLRKADIYFCNLTRVFAAMRFHYAVEMTRYGSEKEGFNFSDMFYDFDVMMLAVMKFRERGKVVVPYIKPICSDPRIIMPFPIAEEVFDIILTEREKSRK